MAAASALVLSGCSSTEKGEGGSTEAGSGIITVNGTEPQNSLIPTNTNEVGGGKIIDAIFEGLVYYDAEGETHNGVAESIETEDGGLNWTVKLREDAVFEDGSSVMAKNFVDAWNYGADLNNAQLSIDFFEPIEGWEVSDGPDGEAGTDDDLVGSDGPLSGLEVTGDYEFTIKLKEAGPDFADRLGYSAFYPLPDVAFEDMDAFGANPVGNGVYKLDEWKHNAEIDLGKSETYVGDRKVANDGLKVILYASQDAAYTDLLDGKLDVLDAIPESALGSYESDLGDRAVNQAAAIFQSFTIPERLEHFGGEEGKLRRQAISMAIDREEITEVIFSGTRIPAGDFTSPVVDGWTDELKGGEVLEFNPEEAKKLWAEADAISPWSGTFSIGFNSDGGHDGWVEAVLNQIKNTLEIDVAPAPYATFPMLREEVTNRTIQGAFRTGWQADYPGAFNFLSPIYATGAGSNDGDYSNPEFDKLIRDAGAEADRDKKVDLLHQAQEVLLQDLPATPLWYAGVNGGFSEHVDNVKFGWNSVPYYSDIVKK